MVAIFRDENVRELGKVEDFDGRRLPVGVDYDTVTAGQYRLTRAQSLEFGRLFMAAYAAACEFTAAAARLELDDLAAAVTELAPAPAADRHVRREGEPCR